MTALNVTPVPEIAAALIEITGAPAGPVTITRHDANGTGTVRLMPNQEPISGGLTCYDSEVAVAGPVTYEVLDSAAATTTDTLVMTGAQPVIMAAVLPQTRQFPTAVMDYESARESGATVHRPIGRPDPIVISGGRMRLRQGSLSCFAASYVDAQALADTADSGEVLMFRQPDYTGMDMYFVPQRVSVRPRSDASSVARRWDVEIEYIETRSPEGPMLGSAGWDYADVAATFATYDDLEAAFATYNALVVGP